MRGFEQQKNVCPFITLTTMQIYAHEFQLAQAKPKDVLEQGIESARERLEADKKALPEKVTAQKVKVAIKCRKKP